MFRFFLSLSFLIITLGCSEVSKNLPISNFKVCEPLKLFKPTHSKVTYDGLFIFSEDRLDYFYNISKNSWTCEKPKLKIVNIFNSRSTLILFNTIQEKNNAIYAMNETEITMGDMMDFKSFTTKKCTSQGLSYFFEIKSNENEKIYGCQLTPNISSAIMWKQTSQKPSINIAYISLYQPFIDKIFNDN